MKVMSALLVSLLGISRGLVCSKVSNKAIPRFKSGQIPPASITTGCAVRSFALRAGPTFQADKEKKKGPKKKVPGVSTRGRPNKNPQLKSRQSGGVNGGQVDGSSVMDSDVQDNLLGSEHSAFKDEMRAFRQANSPRKLVNCVQGYLDDGALTQGMTAFALRTLTRMGRRDLFEELIPLWQQAEPGYVEISARGRQPQQEQQLCEPTETSVDSPADSDAAPLTPTSQSALDLRPALLFLRTAFRMERADLAEVIAGHAGVAIGQTDAPLDDVIRMVGAFPVSQYANQNRRVLEFVRMHDAHLMLLPELALGYATVGAHKKACRTLKALEARIAHISEVLPQTLGLELSNTDVSGGTGSLAALALDGTKVRMILKAFINSGRTDDIRRALHLLLAVNGRSGLRQENSRSDQDNDILQLLCNAYLKDLTFVKGAVSMDTLPPSERPEVAFIGRSNVGKSSLINMLTNRKGLAYTSKTPGKTSEFNYFDAKSEVGADGEKKQFFLVDIPGVGFARKDMGTRSAWLDLLRDFTSQRRTLRMVFHLVDSRHGIMDADNECFGLLETLPPTCQYCVVLTKADKRGGVGRSSMVSAIRTELEQRMAANEHYRLPDGSPVPVPVVLTSAETRQGAAELWSVMLDGMEGDMPEGFVR